MHTAAANTHSPPPSLEALVVGTVALMSSWGAHRPEARIDCAAQRSLLARKAVSNQFFVQNHPCASAARRPDASGGADSLTTYGAIDGAIDGAPSHVAASLAYKL